VGPVRATVITYVNPAVAVSLGVLVLHEPFTASIGAGFAVMAFSRYPGMRLFGILMPFAMATSCLAALSIMPVLVLRSRPAFVFGTTSTPLPGAAPGRAVG